MCTRRRNRRSCRLRRNHLHRVGWEFVPGRPTCMPTNIAVGMCMGPQTLPHCTHRRQQEAPRRQAQAVGTEQVAGMTQPDPVAQHLGDRISMSTHMGTKHTMMG